MPIAGTPSLPHLAVEVDDCVGAVVDEDRLADQGSGALVQLRAAGLEGSEGVPLGD